MCKFGSVRNVTVLRQDNVAKVDACLAPLVYLLNQFGIKTIAGCCGHGKTKVASIRIHPKNIRLSVLDEGFTAWLEFPYPGGGPCEHDWRRVCWTKKSVMYGCTKCPLLKLERRTE